MNNDTVLIPNTLVASHTMGIQEAGGTVTAWDMLFSNVGMQIIGRVTNIAPVTGKAAFVNPANVDYPLTVFSVAINAGTTPNPHITFDIAGDACPRQGGYNSDYTDFGRANGSRKT